MPSDYKAQYTTILRLVHSQWHRFTEYGLRRIDIVSVTTIYANDETSGTSCFFFLSLLISCQLVLCVFAFCLVGFDLVCYFNGIFNMILDQNVWPFFIIYASISIQITSCLLHFNSLLNNKNSHFFLLNCHFKFLFLLQFHSLCLYRI